MTEADIAEAMGVRRGTVSSPPREPPSAPSQPESLTDGRPAASNLGVQPCLISTRSRPERARADDPDRRRLPDRHTPTPGRRRRNHKRMIGGAALGAVVVVAAHRRIAIGARRGRRGLVGDQPSARLGGGTDAHGRIVPAPSSTDAPDHRHRDPSTTTAGADHAPAGRPVHVGRAPTGRPRSPRAQHRWPSTAHLRYDRRPGVGPAREGESPPRQRSTLRHRSYQEPLRPAPGRRDGASTAASLLRYIAVNRPGVTTLSGIGVGTPVSTLQAKLPTLVRNDDNGRLVVHRVLLGSTPVDRLLLGRRHDS